MLRNVYTEIGKFADIVCSRMMYAIFIGWIFCISHVSDFNNNKKEKCKTNRRAARYLVRGRKKKQKKHTHTQTQQNVYPEKTTYAKIPRQRRHATAKDRM